MPWWLAWLFRAHDPIAHEKLAMLETRLNLLGERLDQHHAKLRDDLRLPPMPPPPPGPIRHDCGDVDDSYATIANGITECRACHQRRFAHDE